MSRERRTGSFHVDFLATSEGALQFLFMGYILPRVFTFWEIC